MFERTYIGLDVHALTIVACALDTATGEVSRDKMAAVPGVVLSWLGRFDPGAIQIVYEAGPTGFGLVRHLRENGIDLLGRGPLQTPAGTWRPRQNG